jgi:hypothetical protein
VFINRQPLPAQTYQNQQKQTKITPNQPTSNPAFIKKEKR